MKGLSLILGLLLATSAAAADYKGSYVCLAKGESLRQHSATYNADGRIHFTKYQDGEKTLFKNVVGHLSAGYDEAIEYSYYGVFKFEQAEANAKYRGRTYKQHDQIKDFDATATSNNDGGGMWGYLVINKDTSTPTFDAHYVFQAGDHMGGTVDFTCKKD
jgi:hypothetical protein